MSKILFVVPSNKNIKYAERYLFSDESIKSLDGILNSHECYLSFVSQRASDIEFYSCASKFGFKESFYFYEAESCPPKMHALRQIGINAMADADFFFFVDDNIEFSDDASKRIKDAVEYLECNSRAGCVQFESHFGGTKFGNKIIPSKTIYTTTSRGLLIKNVFMGIVYDESQLKLTGGFEDASVGINLLLNGYYISKSFNNFTKHHDKLRISYDVRRFIDDNELHELSHADENFFKWFEERFGEFKRKVGKYGCIEISTQWNKKIEDIYLANGGSLEVFTQGEKHE